MRCADWMVELGPGSGEAGGQVVYQGPAAGVREAGTLTGQYLSGEKRIGVPSARRPAARWVGVKGARLHNLRDVDVRVPLGTLTAVTGVSGSGKSTLVHDVLYRQLEARLRGTHSAKQHLGEPVGDVRSLEGWEALADVVLVDQSPIGRTPRSNPITYVKAFDELRGLFAAAPLARERRYSASTFSFNVAGGRCQACEGAGHVLVEMVFLANVFVPCDVCQGKRFKPEVLEVKLDGSSIHDVLDWPVAPALQRFHRHPRLARALWLLQQPQRAREAGVAGETLERGGHGPVEHVVDRAAVELYLEHLGLEALPLAHVARDEHVGEEHHLDQHVSRALARLAAPACHVEGERARAVTPLARQRRRGEQAAQLVERLHVRDGIGARGTPDRRLIHQDDVRKRLPPLERAYHA